MGEAEKLSKSADLETPPTQNGDRVNDSRVSDDRVLDPDATQRDSAEFAAAISMAPSSIGPYKLIRRLGEGGMGSVWLAEQTAPVKRNVAIKLIRSGRFSEDGLKRFDLERQSLAIMNHPAIAKVFDAGSTGDGQPYFVMEYVTE